MLAASAPTPTPRHKPRSWILAAARLGPHHLALEDTSPTRTDLDAVTGDHPAIFTRIDGHIAVANSAALAAAGISADDGRPSRRQDRPRRSGNPTGIVREGPGPCPDHRQNPAHQRRRPAPRPRTSPSTTLSPTASPPSRTSPTGTISSSFARLEDTRQAPPPRLRVARLQPAAIASSKQRRASHDPNDPLLHLAMLKASWTARLGSRTAALRAPTPTTPTTPASPATIRTSSTRCRPSAPPPASSSASTPSATKPTTWPSTPSPPPNRSPCPPTLLPTPAAPGGAVVTQSCRRNHPLRASASASSTPRCLLPGDFDRFAQTRRHRLHAAVAPAHRHELGRRTPRPRARQVLLRLALHPRPPRHPRLRHRLSCRVDQPLPRPLRRHHSPERGRHPDLPAAGKDHPPRSHLRLHPGLAPSQSSANTSKAASNPATSPTSSCSTATSQLRRLSSFSTPASYGPSSTATSSTPPHPQTPTPTTPSTPPSTRIMTRSSHGGLSDSTLAHILLLAVVLVWGATFALIKDALADVSPLLFNLLRMALAFIALAIINHRSLRNLSRRAILSGLVVGLFLAAGYQFQTAGLARTTPAKSAFITGLVVVCVPLLTAIPILRPTGTHPPRWNAALGAIVAFAGLLLLTTPAGTLPREIFSTIGIGDLLTLACAISFAGHLLALARAPFRNSPPPN